MPYYRTVDFRPVLFAYTRFVVFLMLLCCMSGAVSLLEAQSKSQVLIKGTVMDTLNKPIQNVEVLALDSKKKIVATTKSSQTGHFTLPVLRPGTYRFIARAIGYMNGGSQFIEFKGGDSLVLAFVLDGSQNTLAEVKIVAPAIPAYQITAAEMAKLPYRDALDVLVNKRMRMLGDTWKGCAPDTSKSRDSSFRNIRKPNVKGMSVLERQRVDRMTGDTVIDTTFLGPPFRLFINGQPRAVRSIKDVLADIPLDDIQEMNYVDCNDKIRPQLQNSLLIVLKPEKMPTY